MEACTLTTGTPWPAHTWRPAFRPRTWTGRGDVPGIRTKGGIAEIEGNYPSKGARGERGAWFRDSEGNLLGIGEPVV
ncbi:hypothetical protein [Streptomyces sp. WM6372]|uniref:hypothetical protein n=1 Tax=Streptomyces sp. WM6372 TaxID=1415555 RepID=UPI000A88F437